MYLSWDVPWREIPRQVRWERKGSRGITRKDAGSHLAPRGIQLDAMGTPAGYREIPWYARGSPRDPIETLTA